MNYQVITISRQFGSGGRTIGRELAKKLDIPCYDQELIEKIALESGFAQDYVAARGEDASHGNWLASALSDRDFNGHSKEDRLWAAQRQVILELPKQGPCVIVGRCADAILQENASCLTAFIHASIEKRVERIVQQYGERTDTPERRLKDKDKRRSTYYQFYTGRKWGAVENYHIALDSGELGLDLCIQILTQLASGKN